MKEWYIDAHWTLGRVVKPRTLDPGLVLGTEETRETVD